MARAHIISKSNSYFKNHTTMKANYQMQEIPESGVQVTIEGTLVRLLFDFSKPDSEGGDTPAEDIYDCESVDVRGRGYGDIVAAIVNDRYNSDSVQAIMANYAEAIDAESDIEADKRTEYVAEYNEYQSFRKHAKDIAHKVIELINR